MNKKVFKHECGMLAGNGTGARRTGKRKKQKMAGTDKESMKEIYNRYYRNQVEALYNAVRGN